MNGEFIGQKHEMWRDRWEVLEKVISTLRNRQLSFPRSKIARALYSQLREFAGSHFDAFDGWLANNRLQPLSQIPNSSKWASSKLEYPVNDHLLNAIINQIALDIETIWNLREQFIFSALDADTFVRETLQVGDWLATDAMDSFDGALDETAHAFAYMKTKADTRVIPYAPVSMVGIPITAASVNQDFLFIPHEIGHFVYWHAQSGPDNKKFHVSLAEDLAGDGIDDKSKSFAWIEEIVADVVGCLLAGPVMALRLQDFMLLATGKHFSLDDADYPPPSLRPFVALQTLRAMEQVDAGLCSLLADRWQAVRSIRQCSRILRPIQTIPSRAHRLRPPAVTEYVEEDDTNALSDLEKIVPHVVKRVQPLLGANQNFWTELPAVKLSPGQPLQALYDDFNVRMITLRKTVEKGYAQRFDDTHIADPAQVWAGCYNWDRLSRGFEHVPGALQALVIDYQTWIPLFRFNGWTTEGPGAGNSH